MLSWSISQHVRWGEAFNSSVAALLLAMRRLEGRGDVVAMDPAVVEEALTQLTCAMVNCTHRVSREDSMAHALCV